jgi:hypothetical protein
MLGTISVAVMLPTKIEISLGPDLAATLQGSGSSGLAPDCFVKLVTNLVFAALRPVVWDSLHKANNWQLS